jgi:hypothetical protein
MEILKTIFEYILLAIFIVFLLGFLIFSAFLVAHYPTQTIAFTLLFALLARAK